MMNMKAMKRLYAVITLLVICSVQTAFCEQIPWDCPECGRTGNTGNYCGGCAHSAPWIETSTSVQDRAPDSIIGFWLNEDEVVREMESLFQQASKWTKDSAPKTLSEFPLVPNNFAEMLEKVVNADNTFTANDDSFIWLTNAMDLLLNLTGSVPGTADYEVTYFYIDENPGANEKYPTLTMDALPDQSGYVVSIPNNNLIPKADETPQMFLRGRDAKLSLDISLGYKDIGQRKNGYVLLSYSLRSKDGLIQWMASHIEDGTSSLAIAFGEHWLTYDLQNEQLTYFK